MKLLFLVSILGLLSLAADGIASALTYKQDVGVNFTFNSSLSLTLSADDLHIYNLAPGSASDSNVINVKVLTNSVGGYTLNATVGNNTTYNTRNLIHSNSNISDNFASIDYSSSPTITTNTNLDADKWAFSFSLDNGTNWSNYNGLPLYSDTTNVATLKTSTEPSINANGDDVKFKIAAKASDNKASGDYHNVINFNVVAAPAPVTLANAFEAAGKTQLYGYYQMQDMTSAICSAVEVEDDQLQLIDNRDNKVYWVAKLADGNCWMTQNLDHDIVTNTNFYTYYNTDIGHGTTTNTSATWTAMRATYATTSTQTHEWCVGGTINIDNQCENNDTPESYNPGDIYWNLETDEDWHDWGDYYNSCNHSYSSPVCNQSLNPISTYTSSSGNEHYHLGNYYNWAASLAVNDSSGYTGDDMAEQSICPAGWTLPRTGSGDDSFQALWEEYGYTTQSSFSDISTLWSNPLYFTVGGSIYDGVFSGVGFNVSFWSSVARGSWYGRSASFNVDTIESIPDPSSFSNRYEGISVRCIAR